MKRRLWFSIMTLIMLLSTNAWATVAPPSGIGLAKTNSTGIYSVSIGGSSTSGASYILEEATNSGFTTDYASYDLGTSLSKAFSGKTNNTYYYRAKAYKSGDTDSAWTITKNIAVTLTVAPPSGIGLGSSNLTGSYSVSIGGSSTSGASYILEEATNSGFTTDYASYDLGTSLSKAFSGKTNNTYYYRAKAYKSGMADSAWTITKNVAVNTLFISPPSGIGLGSSNLTGNYSVSIGGSSTSGVSYILEEATDSGFTTDYASYDLGTSLSKAFSGKADNTYYYRAKAYKSGMTDSAWTITKNVVVALTVAPPNGIGLADTNSTGTFTVTIGGSSTAGASYVLEEATSADFLTGYTSYALGSETSKSFTDKPSAFYYYRAKATKTDMSDSAWTITKSVALANVSTCVNCHSTQQTAWTAGQHSNLDTKPIYNSSCTGCHSPSKELTNGKMAISCVGCHKPGVPTLTNPLNHTAQGIAGSDLLNSCRACHDGDHIGSGNDIGAKVAAGPHGSATGHTTGTCQRCHATEGAIAGANRGWTGSYAVLTANQNTLWGTSTVSTPAQPVSTNGIACSACHDSHTGNLRAVKTSSDGSTTVAWDPNANATVDQYDVCTSCHTLTDNLGAVVGNYHNGGSVDIGRTISDTHYDNPATGVGLTSNVVEGYALRSTAATACADCHDVHSADVAIQNAWANSAHAGKIKAKKDALTASAIAGPKALIWWNATYPANLATTYTESKTISTSTRTVLAWYQRSSVYVNEITAAGALDDHDGNGWTHYNWDQTSSRGACQRCHTSTGIMNYLNSPTTYVAAGTGNTFSHLSGWSASTGSPQNELLYCWGCHSSVETGALRNPGAITENYTATTTGGPVVTVTYADLGPSNVCMGCHLGREVGNNVATDTDADGVRSFINSHYLAAGSTIFNQSGYEYAGQSYNSLGYHKNVGMNDAYGTGTSGPCVACHMSSAQQHSFSVVTEDTGGVITAITSTTCANCHGGLTAATLETSKEEFHIALTALKTALDAKGIYFYEAHPYFYAGAGGTGGAFTNWASVYGLASWKDVMGAAFNYNLFEHDPGAYAHNRQYSLKLIVDSIDFLADGTVDGNGIPANVAAVITNKEFAEATSHTASTLTNPSTSNCGTCHTSAPHYGGAVLTQAQYVISSSANTSSCADCHVSGNPVPSTINAQFAESGHGNVKGDPWYHYDWRTGSRAACARCHNATAYVAKLGIETNTTSIFNAGDANLPNEVLTCTACHTNVATGDVRTPGAYTETYGDGAIQAFPDLSKSNLCMRCHSGRESGDTIKAKPATPATLNFVNSHYLTAGAQLFTTSGYEYDVNGNSLPDDYNNSPAYLHDDAGFATPGSPVATDSGPCAFCHMGNGQANHTWEPLAKDETGSITAVTSSACIQCHEGLYALTPAQLNSISAQYQASLVALDKALQAKGIFFANANPYFFKDSGYGGSIASNGILEAGEINSLNSYTAWGTAYGDANWKNTMGAAFNLNLLEHDPGGFAHNSKYSRRLLRDAIDWIDNGAIDNSVPATLTSLQLAGKITAQQLSDVNAYLGATRP